MAFIILLIIVVAIIVVLCKIVNNNKINIPKIQECTNVVDVVMSVNHGRIYPFFTRMNYQTAKQIAMRIHPNKEKFEDELQIQELMGIKHYFDIPISNECVEGIFTQFNSYGLLSSISIDIKNFDVNIKELINEMTNKFGRPYSMDDHFIIWREGSMVVNISKNGSLCVIDEALFGC